MAKKKKFTAIGYFWLLANFTILTFVLVSHKYFGEAVLRPLACCVRWQLRPFVTPLSLTT